MSTSDDLFDGEPPTIDPYEVLGLERTAPAEQVKSAYRKLALKNHPDKVPEDQKQKAHDIFQSIALAYAVLSDPSRRKRYDETGSTSESIVDSDGFSWSDFYREQFRDAISGDALEKFAAKYKGSDEERDDILVAYEEHEGKMDAIYETVMLSDVLKDDERFRKIIDDAIASKDVPAFKAYTKESKKARQARIKAAKDEGAEAEEYAKELGIHDKIFGNKKSKKKGSSEDELAALIRGNQQSRESFLDNLASKYGAAPKTAKKGKKRRYRRQQNAMTSAASLAYYPQYCFHLSPTINKWCPLRAADIAGLQCRPGFEDINVFFYLNHPIQWVRITGVVVAIDHYFGHQVYTIDDSTGQCIECVVTIPKSIANNTNHHGIGQGKETERCAASSKNTTVADVAREPGTINVIPPVSLPPDIDIGMVLDVKGSVKLFRGQKQIKIQKVTRIQSTNQEVLFWDKIRDFRNNVLSQPWALKEKEVRRCRKLQLTEGVNSGDREKRKKKAGEMERIARTESLRAKASDVNQYDALGL
ncbi:hypothetical protein F5Y19DRAFT_461180 [Xylariaceae sp. FL1651]|nr:hypothetical protein F5Y19DRAFT_461180 [Xylariaceae sp. FL1651]